MYLLSILCVRCTFSPRVHLVIEVMRRKKKYIYIQDDDCIVLCRYVFTVYLVALTLASGHEPPNNGDKIQLNDQHDQSSALTCSVNKANNNDNATKCYTQ